MKDKNSSNNKELSVRERMALDKEIRRVSAEIRKEHPSDWREILKSTDVYLFLTFVLQTGNCNFQYQ